MKDTKSGVEKQLTRQDKIQNQILLDGVWVGMLLMYLYFIAFASASRTVLIVGLCIPLALVAINYVGNKIARASRRG